jgi:hypothetical protein
VDTEQNSYSKAYGFTLLNIYIQVNDLFSTFPKIHVSRFSVVQTAQLNLLSIGQNHPFLSISPAE